MLRQLKLLQITAGKLRAWNSRRNRAKVFTEIYRNGSWGDRDSKSGTGSSEKATKLIRKELPALFKSLQITSMIDIPCGDFHWMRLILEPTGPRYLGLDIVHELIGENRRRYACAGVEFDVLDVVKSIPPAADLIFCRHLLIHLPLQDAVTALNNFARSGSKYLLVTNQPDCKNNEEISWTGAYRPLNLALPPFKLKSISRIPDGQSPTDQAELALYRLEDLSL